MIAQKLGNEDAALYRFTHPVLQPNPPATPPPALSNTVVERNPSLPGSQRVTQASTTPMQTSKTTTETSQSTTTQQGLQQSRPQQAPVSSAESPSREGTGAAGAPDLPRKQPKAGVQYAAGNAQLPIMLAEIKVSLQSYSLTLSMVSALQAQVICDTGDIGGCKGPACVSHDNFSWLTHLPVVLRQQRHFHFLLYNLA